MNCKHPACAVEHLNNYSKFKDYCSFDCYLYDNFYKDSGMIIIIDRTNDDEWLWVKKYEYDLVMKELLHSNGWRTGEIDEIFANL